MNRWYNKDVMMWAMPCKFERKIEANKDKMNIFSIHKNGAQCKSFLLIRGSIHPKCVPLLWAIVLNCLMTKAFIKTDWDIIQCHPYEPPCFSSKMFRKMESIQWNSIGHLLNMSVFFCMSQVNTHHLNVICTTLKPTTRE